MDAATDWVFATPWWVLAIAVTGAAALLLFSLAKRSKRLVAAACAVMAAALAWAGVAALIKAPTELARSRTEEMIAAYTRGDWQRLSQLVDPETRFATLLKGQEIVEAAKLTHAAMGHDQIAISKIETSRDGVGVRVFVRIISTQTTQFVHRAPTLWKFDYRKRGDEWKLELIDPMDADNIDRNSILRNVRLPADLQDRGR